MNLGRAKNPQHIIPSVVLRLHGLVFGYTLRLVFVMLKLGIRISSCSRKYLADIGTAVKLVPSLLDTIQIKDVQWEYCCTSIMPNT